MTRVSDSLVQYSTGVGTLVTQKKDVGPTVNQRWANVSCLLVLGSPYSGLKEIKMIFLLSLVKIKYCRDMIWIIFLNDVFLCFKIYRNCSKPTHCDKIIIIIWLHCWFPKSPFSSPFFFFFFSSAFSPFFPRPSFPLLILIILLYSILLNVAPLLPTFFCRPLPSSFFFFILLSFLFLFVLSPYSPSLPYPTLPLLFIIFLFNWSNLTWTKHVKYLCNTVCKTIGVMNKLQSITPGILIHSSYHT